MSIYPTLLLVIISVLTGLGIGYSIVRVMVVRPIQATLVRQRVIMDEYRRWFAAIEPIDLVLANIEMEINRGDRHISIGRLRDQFLDQYIVTKK